MSAPLQTLKILDFSTLLPGPYASMMLADLGADVIRIEAPNRPDLTRLLPPLVKFSPVTELQLWLQIVKPKGKYSLATAREQITRIGK